MNDIKKTSLHMKHVNLKAKMAPFGGFEMPIQYTSVKDETLAVRNSAGVFDVSHMGEFFIEGKDAVSFVDYLITNNFITAENEKAVYSPLCREDGTVIDDLIAYKLSESRVLICVNASNIKKDWDWISSKTNGFEITLTDQSDKYSLLALQGPDSEKILNLLDLMPSGGFSYYSAKELSFKGKKYILARTGYTGEDGFEIFGDHDFISQLWDNVLNTSKASPCGLASRDVLRLEVCYPLYGHELNDSLTPLDAGLKWAVKMNKKNFIGKDFLSNYKPKYRLIKLSLEKGIPRDNYQVLNDANEPIGKVTSGTMSVINGNGICLALVERSKFPENKVFKIEIRNKVYKANYHTKTFVTGGHK